MSVIGRESIDRGLAEAPKCIVVLSPNFLSNPGWAKGEFNAAMNNHFRAGGGVVLPIWHNVASADVATYSSLVSDISALRSDIGLDVLADKLFTALKPLA
ncbi:toll/interleukin-1 receptor domain-containing protein [Nocardia sp. NPDC004711]